MNSFLLVSQFSSTQCTWASGSSVFIYVSCTWSAHPSHSSHHRFFLSSCLPTGLIDFNHSLFVQRSKMNSHLMNLQVYSCLSSNQFTTLPYSVSIQSGFNHCVVRFGDIDAADNSLLYNSFKRRWQEILQHCLAYREYRKWKFFYRWRRIYWLRRFHLHTVHFHPRLCNSTELDSYILLSRLEKIENCWTEVKIKRKETLPS